MNDLPPKRPDEGNPALNQELENVEAHLVSPEFTIAARYVDVKVTATPSRANSFITVDWHPHVSYSSLIRVNQTTDHPDTLLSGYDPEFPSYEDRGIDNENSYIYELYVPNNPGSPFKSDPTTRHQTRAHPIG